MSDGRDREEDEEERPTVVARNQLARAHRVFCNTLVMCMLAFPQFYQFDAKEELDDCYE